MFSLFKINPENNADVLGIGAYKQFQFYYKISSQNNDEVLAKNRTLIKIK